MQAALRRAYPAGETPEALAATLTKGLDSIIEDAGQAEDG